MNCLNCGKPLKDTTSNQNKKFCDEKCRAQYRRNSTFQKRGGGTSKVELVDVQDFSKELISQLKSQKRIIRTPRIRNVFKGKLAETAVLMLSDIHGGQINQFLEPGETQVKTTYDTNAMFREGDRLVDGIETINHLLSHSYQLDKLYIFGLGDLVENDIIFKGQRFFIDKSVGNQLKDVVEMLTSLIERFLESYKEIEFINVIGNHGRMSVGREAAPVANNFDYLAGYMLQTIFKHEPRVKITLPETWYYFVDIYNWRYFLHHGDTVYSWMCVDDKTECLTFDGWKQYNELKIGELVLTYNQQQDLLEYQPIQHINITPNYNGEMIHVQSKLLDCMMTPEHRCYVLHNYKRGRSKQNNYRVERYEKKLEVKRAEELNNSDDILLTATSYKGHDEIIDWSDNEIKLLGWLLTEGHIIGGKRGRAKITQSPKHNPIYCLEIEKIFEALNIDVKIAYSKNGRKIVESNKSNADRIDYLFYLPKKFLDKNVIKAKPFPRWILKFPQKQLEVLFETLLKGDGTKGHNAKILNCFYQKDLKSCEVFQELAFKCGYRASLSDKHPTCNAIWLRKTKGASLTHLQQKIKKIKYKGTIWCVGTENKTWVARRNRKIWITGNSLPYYGLKRQGTARRIEMPFNIECIGHFHQSMEIPISGSSKTLVNGCWIPKSDYSWRKFGVLSKAEQYYFGVSPKRPRSWGWTLDLLHSKDEWRQLPRGIKK